MARRALHIFHRLFYQRRDGLCSSIARGRPSCLRTRAGECVDGSNGWPRWHCWLLRVGMVTCEQRICPSDDNFLTTMSSSGNINLPKLFPFLGSTQLQVLSFLSAFLLLFTFALTVVAVRERVLLEPSSRRATDDDATRHGIFTTIKDIWANMWTLPYVIMRIVSNFSREI